MVVIIVSYFFFVLEPEIVIMSNLVAAYEKMENKKFEDILKHKSIQEDPFIRDYVPELLVMIQTKVLLRLLQAYSSLRIQYIATVSDFYFFWKSIDFISTDFCFVLCNFLGIEHNRKEC